MRLHTVLGELSHRMRRAKRHKRKSTPKGLRKPKRTQIRSRVHSRH